MKVYEAAIKPMARPNEWPMTHREPPLPPLFKTRTSRPKKLRKTNADENLKQKNNKFQKMGSKFQKIRL